VSIRVAYTLEQCWHRVPGGTATSALGVARALTDATRVDDEIDLAGVAARHRRGPADEFRPPVAVHMMSLPRRVLYESWHTLRRPRVETVTGPVDVIHATGMAIPPRTKPLVVTVHDLAFVHHPEHATRNGLRFFRQSLALTRRDADLVLCPSDATRRDCVAAGIDDARMRVVPWGVDPVVPASSEQAQAVLARHGLRARAYVLFAGTIEPRKNLAALAAAFAAVDNSLELALVGPAGWNEDLDALLAPVRDRVRVLGFVPRASLDVLYANATAFCYPSLLEGFGMPVLEAMAAGAAVITSSGTATEEVAGDAGVLVDPHDHQAIARAIDRIAADDVFARGRRDAALARAAQFTWRRAADLTVDAYRSVTA
jgi:glycosyltransferase involved in cell wall biosynthesis